MQPIITFKERCKRCYSCVRSCPVKAIKVDKGFAEIIYDRCIGCGNCLSCPQQAKVIVDRMSQTEQLLASGSPVVAVLGCSFPAFFKTISSGQLVAALKKLGFCEVHEGAYGAGLIADSYRDAIKVGGKPLISSHCPAVVDLIERHLPKLLPNLVDVVSPMIAMGRFIKGLLGESTKVVYLSNCIAAKFEVQSDESAGAIDVVLTYHEIENLFKSAGINPATLAESFFDGLPPERGRIFSLVGGPLKVFGIEPDFMDTDIIVAEGEHNTISIIRDLAADRISPSFLDIRFCDGGCVTGPCNNNESNHFYKRKSIIKYSNSSISYQTAAHYKQSKIIPNLRRTFSDKLHRLPSPGKGDIKRIMLSTNKFTQSDELNCRACGYNTCREHAVAVYQGLADTDMCMPYNLQQIEEDRGRLMQKYELARRELDRQQDDYPIVGNDAKIQEVMELIRQVGPTPTTVLISGETGTGKELTARAIHRTSLLNDKPLVTVNCTTITDSLLESELFGHKKGAFTGAVGDRKGLFEAANGGTIFLDEIGDITPKLQAELLRVLDLGEVRPVGDSIPKKVNVRLIAATNKDLELGVREGWFREDLYYRLNVFCIHLPPLRERTDSIPSLAEYFLDHSRKKLKKNIEGIEERAVKAMQHYPWPGNIREMRNVIERSAVLSDGVIIRLENLPTIFADTYAKCNDDIHRRRASFRSEREIHVSRTEKNLIQRYIEESAGNVSKAARLANIPRRTFYRLLEKHGLDIVQQVRDKKGAR